MADYELIQADCLAWMFDEHEDSVDMVFGSPPYATKGKRYSGSSQSWPLMDWIRWMTDVTVEATRLSRGYVIWVANGCVRQGQYQPAVEGLLWSLQNHDIKCRRPFTWIKSGPPTGGKDWFSNAWEYVLACWSGDEAPAFDWEAVATSPLYDNGGPFHQRDQRGLRRLGSDYPKNKLARPP